MARYEDEDKPVRAALPEPLHERVTVLEKQARELREIVNDLQSQLEAMRDRVARELGL